jgi:hypothetical protein
MKVRPERFRDCSEELMSRAGAGYGTIIHADESNAWERLHASYDVRRVDHSVEYKAEEGHRRAGLRSV